MDARKLLDAAPFEPKAVECTTVVIQLLQRRDISLWL